LPQGRLRADLLIPLLLTALALGFRITTLSLQPLSGDEAMHLQALGLWETIHLDLAFNPPLFRLLVRLCTSVTATPVAARLIPLLAGVATVPALYFIGRRRLSIWGASFAALLLTIHPWHIRHSQTVRAYSLMTLLWLISLTHSWSSVSDSSADFARRKRIQHVGIALLLLLTHYLGFVLLAIEVGILLYHRKWEHTLLLGGLLALAAIGLAPLLGFGAGEKMAGAAVAYTSGLPFVLAELKTIATPGGLSLVAFWFLAGAGLLAAPMRIPALAAAGALLATPLLGLAMPIELRYVLPALPVVLLLAGAGAARLLESEARVRRIGTISLMVLAVAGTGYLIPTYYRSPSQPRLAMERHRDLVHEATPMAQLTGSFRVLQGERESLPLVLVGRGRVQHQVLLALGGGSYPPVSVEHSSRTSRLYTGHDFILIAHESPDSPRVACPQWPEPPFALLLEAPLSCDLPAICQQVESAVKFSLYYCQVDRHRNVKGKVR